MITKVLILILIILFYLRRNVENFIMNDNKWIGYRLGDIIKGYFLHTKNYKYLNMIKKRLPNSIGACYIKETEKIKNVEDKKNNFKILNKIIELKSKNMELPNEKDIVIHLRIGDIIKNYGTNNKYDFSLNLNELEKILREHQDNKVILVYGSHKKNIDKKKNDEYLEKVRQMLNKYNIIYEEKNSGNPDNDFIFMANSKRFIKSGGGFSKIIGDLVIMKGGKVLN